MNLCSEKNDFDNTKGVFVEEEAMQILMSQCETRPKWMHERSHFGALLGVTNQP